MKTCAFCSILSGAQAAHVVLERPDALAFLDHRPVFRGHVLVVPRRHVETLVALDRMEIGPLFEVVQVVTAAVQEAMAADGSFVAMNNVVSQSVPHLHVHVVPRRRKDGLRGFFWPRLRYADDDDMSEVAERIRTAIR